MIFLSKSRIETLHKTNSISYVGSKFMSEKRDEWALETGLKFYAFCDCQPWTCPLTPLGLVCFLL